MFYLVKSPTGLVPDSPPLLLVCTSQPDGRNTYFIINVSKVDPREEKSVAQTKAKANHPSFLLQVLSSAFKLSL